MSAESLGEISIEDEVNKNKNQLHSCRLWNSSFILFWQASFVSQIGSQVAYGVSSLWLAYNLDSGFKVSVINSLPLLVAVLYSPLSGVISDRFERRVLMILSDIGNALTSFLLAGIVLFGLTDPKVNFWIFVLARFLSGLFTVTFETSSMAILPQIVSRPVLLRANSVMSATKGAGALSGEALGGLAFQFLGAPLVFLIDGISFLFSAVSEFWIPKVDSSNEKAKLSTRQIMTELKSGFHFVSKEKGLIALLGVALLANCGFAGLGTVLAFFIKEKAPHQPQWYGIWLAGFSLGTIVSSLIVERISLVKRFSPKKTMIASLSTMGLALTVFSLFPSPWWGLGTIMLSGLAQGPLNIIIGSSIQTRTPNSVLGRVSGFLGSLFALSRPVGLILTGLFLDQNKIPIDVWFVLSGGMVLVATLIAANSSQLKDYLS